MFLRKLGIEVEVFPFRGNKNPLYYFDPWWKLRQQHCLTSLDLIHVHWGQSGILAVPCKIPMVVTFHGSDLQGFVGKSGRSTAAGVILQKVSRWIAKRAQAVIIVSTHLAEYLPKGVSYNVIPCGIDFGLFHPIPQPEARQRLGLSPDKKYVLFASNPANPIKRYSLALEAVEIAKKHVVVELLVIADVPHDQVALYMNACDVLLFTSAHEGSPTVIKEALACNLPIVSVDVGDVRERIGAIDGCVICFEDTPTVIAQGLIQVLESPQRIQALTEVQNMNNELIVQQIVDIYEYVLKSKK